MGDIVEGEFDPHLGGKEPDELLKASAGRFERVILIGHTKSGEEITAWSKGDLYEVISMLTCALHEAVAKRFEAD